MEYVILGVVVILILVFLSYVGLTGFSQKQRNENLKEENAHRDFSEINPRAGQDAFKYRGK
ncbi:MAG: hypothetical protein ACNA7K_06160 [Acholeplasmataceae bacterium]